MKRTSLRARKVPVAWSDFEYSALQGSFADSFDDAVDEDLIDYDDEREAVEVVVQRTSRTLN